MERVDWFKMEIRSEVCWTEPLHFQFPPTKNLRPERAEVELKALNHVKLRLDKDIW